MKTKTLSLLLLIMVLGSCNQNSNNSESSESSNYGDNYLGYWRRAESGEDGEVLRIFTNNNVYYISDGEHEVPLKYDENEKCLKLHQTSYDEDYIYSAKENQIHIFYKEFGQTTGKLEYKYDFLKK